MTKPGDDTRDKLLEAIRAYWKIWRHTPTVRELAEMVGRSYSTVKLQLDILKAEGLVTFEAGKSRTVRVL